MIVRTLRRQAGRYKRAFFGRLHKVLASRKKVAFGERNNYGVNPLFTTIDMADADICMNFNDTLELPFDDSSVNVVFTSHALEHLPEINAARFLEEAYRILGRRGKLLVELPDCKYLYDSWRFGNRDIFNQFMFDPAICCQIGHPELCGRKDIAFAGVISCALVTNAQGLDHHAPVAFDADLFEQKVNDLPMDEFFAWLLSLQSEKERLSGGHVSAWYPYKFKAALLSVGFRSVQELTPLSRLTIPPFLFRGGSRQTYSFRTLATK